MCQYNEIMKMQETLRDKGHYLGKQPENSREARLMRIPFLKGAGNRALRPRFPRWLLPDQFQPALDLT